MRSCALVGTVRNTWSVGSSHALSTAAAVCAARAAFLIFPFCGELLQAHFSTSQHSTDAESPLLACHTAGMIHTILSFSDVQIKKDSHPEKNPSNKRILNSSDPLVHVQSQTQ